jgi:2-methylcitrate dehydratase PrpD
MAKPLQVGKAAQNGVMCAELAAAGAEANLSAMEAKQGFAQVFNGPGMHHLDEILEALGAPWDLAEPGIGIKLHPCCGGTHSAADASIQLHSELDDIARVSTVSVFVHQSRYAHLNRPNPTGPLDAKFSLQHVVALALLQGAIRIADFGHDQLLRPDVLALRDHTTAEPLPPEREGPERFAAEVRLHLDDGTVRMVRMERPRGRTVETAVSDDEMWRKFTSCVDAYLDANEQKSVYGMLAGIERQSSAALEQGLWRHISRAHT